MKDSTKAVRGVSSFKYLGSILTTGRSSDMAVREGLSLHGRIKEF